MTSPSDSLPVRTLRRLYHRNRAVHTVLSLPAQLRSAALSRRSAPTQRLVRQLGQRLVGDVVLDLPEFAGQFACSPRSDLFNRVVVSGYYEPAMAALLKRHLAEGRDFVDVGANIGFFSVLAARLNTGGRVLAVEPNPSAHRRLVANLERNAVSDRVTVFHGLLSDRAGEAELHQIEGMEEYSSIGRIVHASVSGMPTTTTRAASATLDQLVAEHGLAPGLIKIDVEGAEGLVLAGAQETLRRHRPVVLAECSRALLGPMGTSPETIIAGFKALGYTVLDAEDPELPPAARDYGDILCLPEPPC